MSPKNTRADAQRNRALIVEAATSSLAADPQASVSEIARAAGVGRVTLYGHFPTRDELLKAVAQTVMHDVEADLGRIPLDGDPLETLELIAQAAWPLIDRYQGVVSAMTRGTAAGTSRHDHDHLLTAVRGLIERGQVAGSIRNDLSPTWLASCLYSLLHNAGAETRANRLTEQEVTASLPPTVRAILTTE